MPTKQSELVYSLDVAVAALEAENAALREKLAAAEARTVLTDKQIDRIYGESQQQPLRERDAPRVISFARAVLAASAAPAAQEDAKDAARYRYIRDTETLESTVWVASVGRDATSDEGLDQAAYAAGMDRAIDAAIAANTPKGT